MTYLLKFGIILFMNPEKPRGLHRKVLSFASKQINKLAETAYNAGLILSSRKNRYVLMQKIATSSRNRRDKEELLLIMEVNNMSRMEALALKAQRDEENRFKIPISEFILYDCLRIHALQDRLSNTRLYSIYDRWRYRY